MGTSSVGLRTSATGEGASIAAEAAGASDTGLEPGADIPDAGRDPPKARLIPNCRLSLAPILFNVRSPTDQPPSSTFALVARSRFSFLNLLSASIRSSGVAWRMRPMWRMRVRRLWRVVSAFRALFGEAGETALWGDGSDSASSVSRSSMFEFVGWRSTRLKLNVSYDTKVGYVTHHNGHVPDTFRSQGSMHSG